MIYNPYIVVPLATWAVAQIGKFAVAALRGNVDFRYLYASGGMPSVHSAVVSSLAVTALLIDGPGSHLFGLAIIIAAIVMYDSLGVRRSAGEQAVAINMLISSLERGKVKLDQPQLHLKEILGHQPKEVVVGSILGIVLAGLFNYDRLTAFTAFIQTTPAKTEMIIYAALAVVLVLAGIATKLVLRAKYPKSPAMKKLSSQILVAAETIGWVEALSVVLVYERASYFAWRLWPLLILAIGLSWGYGIFSGSYRVVPVALAAEANQARKLKWLNWGRNKNRAKTKR